MNYFMSTYQKDYIPKEVTVEDKRKYISKSEYKNPLNEGFKSHLDIDKAGPDCVEDVDGYYEKAKEIYECVPKRITGEHLPIDKDCIRKNEIYKGRTVYQVDYCDLEKEIAQKEWERQNAIVLPPDVFIPLTTQKASYRVPNSINSKCYEKNAIFIAKNNLKPNYKLRKILNVTTGSTEYTRKIGALGAEIVEIELHGPVHHDFKGTIY